MKARFFDCVLHNTERSSYENPEISYGPASGWLDARRGINPWKSPSREGLESGT